MPTFYAYTNARIRTMRGELLSGTLLDQLMEASDVMSAVSLLQSSDYRPDIEEGLLHHSGINGVEDGLRRNLSRSLRKVRMVALGDAKVLVDLLLGAWDVQNLKTVMRGRRVGATAKEIMDDMVPAATLDEDDLEQLASQPDVRGVVDMLATLGNPYASPLTDAIAEYHRNQDLAPMEIALDRFYYEYALRRSASLPNSRDVRLARGILKQRIDVTNILTLLKLTEARLEFRADLYLEGGKEVSVDRLAQLHELGDVGEIISALRDTSYGAVLEEEREAFKASGRIHHLERALENEVFRATSKLFIAHPLSIALTIGYLWSKYNEVVNLRVIMRGLETGLDKHDIKEDLMVA